jgi:hypothetical protein
MNADLADDREWGCRVMFSSAGGELNGGIRAIGTSGAWSPLQV